jgi:hypothetical protein
MARAFATNQQINGTTTVAKNLTNFSMAGWIRRPSSASIQNFGINETANDRTSLSHFTDNNIYFTVANGSNSGGFALQDITGWNHFCLTFDGSQSGNSSRAKLYVNSVSQSITFFGTIPATTSNNANNEIFRIGRSPIGGGSWSTGDFAELGMWQATLAAEEVASLAKGMTCDKIRPQSLVYYTPLIRDIQDLARGMTLTNTDTTVANHPRVYA